jgi:8-oxo-dGTP diphosphatase/2-hydroxy-dATP diphosphatase
MSSASPSSPLYLSNFSIDFPSLLSTPTRLYTLLLLTRSLSDGREMVLLGLKKRGFGKGKWNGFGGKVENDKGETIKQAVIREMEEESGIKIPLQAVELVGILIQEFVEPDGAGWKRANEHEKALEIHVFRCLYDESMGEAVESEEMKVQWWPMNSVPFNEMWADDKIWWPETMEKKNKILGYFQFHGNETIVKHQMKIVEESIIHSIKRGVESQTQEDNASSVTK